jgi:hypothetical protein
MLQIPTVLHAGLLLSTLDQSVIDRYLITWAFSLITGGSVTRYFHYLVFFFFSAFGIVLSSDVGDAVAKVWRKEHRCRKGEKEEPEIQFIESHRPFTISYHLYFNKIITLYQSKKQVNFTTRVRNISIHFLSPPIPKNSFHIIYQFQSQIPKSNARRGDKGTLPCRARCMA